MLKLYSYFRSSASFRVRIALNLKGLPYEYAPVHLLRGGGEQHLTAYRLVNAQGIVPSLQENDLTLTQSLAIIEYLDEMYPERPLLPKGALDRARVRAVALAIACEIHPLNNLRVLNYLKNVLNLDQTACDAWYRHWIAEGLASVETMLLDDPRTVRFCHGDTPSLADCFLVPQIFNAQRFNCPLDMAPTVMRVFETCMSLPEFQRAAPMLQPDAEK
jgi:maleylpyruvate isomerase